jgi:hypothetical protein
MKGIHCSFAAFLPREDSAMDDEEMGFVEFLAHSTQARVAHYRFRLRVCERKRKLSLFAATDKITINRHG